MAEDRTARGSLAGLELWRAAWAPWLSLGLARAPAPRDQDRDPQSREAP